MQDSDIGLRVETRLEGWWIKDRDERVGEMRDGHRDEGRRRGR